MYDHGDDYTYPFPLVDFGGGADVTHYIKGPKGKKGYVVDYGVNTVSEAFAAGTATPMMAVGKTGDTDAYAEELDFGALAANTSASLRSMKTPAQIKADYVRPNMEIPADTQVFVTCVAGTGSGLTGQALPWVKIRWAL